MRRTTRTAGRWATAAVVFAASVVSAAVARADLPGLQLEAAPDIYSTFVSTYYDASDERVQAAGYAVTLTTPDESSHTISAGDFQLFASLNGVGANWLEIRGVVEDLGMSSVQTLLHASVSQIVYTAVTGVFEVLGTVEGGVLKDMFGGVGATIGTLLFTATGQSLESDWNSWSDSADTAPPYEPGPEVPEPASWALALGALALLLAGRRRRA